MADAKDKSELKDKDAKAKKAKGKTEESKPQDKTEAKAASKPEEGKAGAAKADEGKAGAAKAEGKPAKGKGKGKPEAKAEGKPEGKPEAKEEGKPEAKAEGKAEGKPEAKTEGKAAIKEEKGRKRPGPAARRPKSKRHRENLTKVDRLRRYSIPEAVTILKNAKSTKFDETVEIAMKLGVDPKKSDQLIRGSVSLPKGIGKTLKVIVFAEGDMAEQAKSAGADVVGGKELIDKIHDENWMDFDVAIALPAMMRFVGKLGKVLGPKGMMPSPKAGTVTEDIVTAVREFKAGKVEYRTDSGGNVHAPVGKKSFSVENLSANIEAFIEHIKSTRPAAAKGTFIHKIVVSSTMGPGISIDFKH